MASANVEKMPKSVDPNLDLDKVKRECMELVNKQARLSAAAAVVPVPLVDVAVDAGLLTKLLPEISYRFGLIDDPSKVDLSKKSDSELERWKDRAVDFAGFVATRSLAKKTFQGFGSRIVAKQVTKFVPFGGQIVAGTIGYLLFKKIATKHINECYDKAKQLQRGKTVATVSK